MANFYKARMENDIQPVILPCTNDSIYLDFSLEPQLIRVRSMNTANLIIDSTDAISFKNKNNPINCILGQFESPGSILMRKVKRMAIKTVKFRHATPNCNARNNQMLIYRKDTGTITEVILPERFIKTPLELVSYIVSELNASPGLAGMNFFIVNTLSNSENIFSIRSLIDFVLLKKSTCVEFGGNMYGFMPSENAETPAQLSLIAKPFQDMGPIYLQYTAFIDFCSTYLNNYTKVPSSTTSFGQNRFVYRMFLPGWDGYTSDPATTWQPSIKRTITDIIENPAFFTWNPEESITSIDMQILDEYGREFYVPEIYTTTTYDILNVKGEGTQWSMIFNCEI